MNSEIELEYPLRPGQQRPRLPMVRTIRRSFHDLLPAMRVGNVRITPLKTVRPLAREDLPLIVITHNDAALLKAFLSHYRALGVTRFICLDDASTDGTRQYLHSQEDVDVFTSNVRFGEARRGRLWRKMLASHYGAGRWYLNVDSDEFLIYRHCERLPLGRITAALEQRGIWHLPAPMLDMYPPGPVSRAVLRDGQMPWEVASLFDASGYSIGWRKMSWTVQGGVRARAFGSEIELIKYPLLHWEALTNLNKSIHFPWPYWRNFCFPLGVLLHFKFFDDFAHQFREVVRNAQHIGEGKHYSNMLEKIGDPDSLVLEHSVSQSYVGSEDLYRRGFFRDWSNA